jgi:cyclopropane fatty-acyl-phospholipid synthase-like methyltransferase
MEKLLAFVPKKKGTILDVACGKGATTRYPSKYYNPRDVTGINISEKQLDRCRVNAPGCNFFLMNATELAFPDESFDNIVCVEAAFHFNTREKFLHAASHVLKRGGRLVLSDILRRYRKVRHPRGVAANYVRDLRQYRNLFFYAGFKQVEIIDATFECWISFHRHALQSLRNRFYRGEIDRPTFLQRRRVLIRRSRCDETQLYYVLVGAQKAC